MKSLFVEAHSLWQKSPAPDLNSLGHDLDCDVCVIGAGIAGLTTAYYLLKEGKRVVVIDREAHLGMHETGLTSAQLSNALDDGYFKLRRIHGEESARLVAESHTTAIDQIEQIVQDEKIDCDFSRVLGYLFLAPEHDIEYLKNEIEASRGAGLQDVELLSRAPVNLFETGPCIMYPRQAQFHPVKYLVGLAKAVMTAGGSIFTETEAASVSSGDPCRVVTDQGHQIHCQSVVVATNVPFNDRITMHTKMGAYRTYIICLELPKGTMEPMHIWDSGDPYHYIRLIQDPQWVADILLVGGEDHRTGQESQPDNRYIELKNWVRGRLGFEPRLVGQWSGQIIEPFDYLAYIGRNPGDKNVYIVTGDSGQGLTHATAGAMILRDLIMDRPNPWAKLYDPGRITLRAADEYIRENFLSGSPYTDWLVGGDVESLEKIPLCEGAVVRDGLNKIAVYRDAYGHPHMFSATCPHLGGVVRWNSSEKTWDCPCHGSRFHKLGEVLNGPAAQGLKPHEEYVEADQTIPLSAEPSLSP